MVKKVIQIGDPILTTPTKEVKDINSPKVKSIITDLIDTCIAMEKRSAGISANQIGEDLSICVCRRTDLEDKGGKKVEPNELWEVMINPKITKASKRESAFWEGCLSIGVEERDTIFGPVFRPDKVTVEFTTPSGETKTLDAEDFFAHVVQHELDHVNGELFIYKVENPDQNLWKAPELDKFYSKNKKYPDIA